MNKASQTVTFDVATPASKTLGVAPFGMAQLPVVTQAMMWYWAAVRPMCVPFPATPLPTAGGGTCTLTAVRPITTITKQRREVTKTSP
ncbi:MAG: hypothetical protein R3F02_19585 [Thiolinea sp.]